MAGPLESAAFAFLLVALAEFGDKTQLVVLALAARGHRGRVLAGAAAAFALLTLLAVVAADLIARVVPRVALLLAAGALFLLFGLWTLREAMEGGEEENEERPTRLASAGAFVASFGLVALAELGDKTQLTVAGLVAAGGQPVATGLGAWLGLVGLTALAVAAGGVLARYVKPRVVQFVAAALFLGAGIVTIVVALL